MQVIEMSKRRHADTVAVLKCMLCDAGNGEIDGVVLCVLRKDGTHATYSTGCFYRDVTMALGAVSRAWAVFAWKSSQ